MVLSERWLKRVVFLLCLTPLAWLLALALRGELGANPIETIIRYFGDWALRLLLLTLAATPLRLLSGWSWPVRLRRLLGLFTFFYAMLHLLAYAVLDQFFDWAAIWEDIVERPFITTGMLAWLLLLALALTSNQASQRRLGRNWKRLHRLIYPAAILAAVHFALMVKADLREPLIYGAILTLLLGLRLIRRTRVYKTLENR
ncbi:sulfite oxidase heme-binding subunit YedZ [Sulfurivermis fontis]|uniref:sulfite oxidase heme-binding subunit YedZ n=1 Tax=Sulfurivermis fontis TaxID=1972068 RepID=UPI000FD89226|nr:protein-methionine-sulfoxide reductase heme-binding subunit MsrQ [Sulfurivermis fontis]